MALPGAIWLDGDGKRSIDADGKTILDNSCGACCCTASSYRVDISGVNLCNCPVTGYSLGNPGWPAPTPGVCAATDYNSIPFIVSYDQLCTFNFSGSINGRWYLPGPLGGAVPAGCHYTLNINPGPISISVNNVVAGRYVCNNVSRIIGPVGLRLDLQFNWDGVEVNSVQFGVTTIFNVPEAGGNVGFNFFAGLLGGGPKQVCDTLCPLDTIPNIPACLWGGTLGTLIVVPTYGGTAKITRQ